MKGRRIEGKGNRKIGRRLDQDEGGVTSGGELYN